MANHAGNMTSKPEKLDQPALDSVSGGFFNTPDMITPDDIGIPLPDFEIPPEIFELPEITIPNIEGPNITLPSFQIDLPPEMIEQLHLLGLPPAFLQFLFPNYTPRVRSRRQRRPRRRPCRKASAPSPAACPRSTRTSPSFRARRNACRGWT